MIQAERQNDTIIYEVTVQEAVTDLGITSLRREKISLMKFDDRYLITNVDQSTSYRESQSSNVSASQSTDSLPVDFGTVYKNSQ
ncbi:hypothetical protein L1765_12370 [Microaerobacter geothermalis]|uniref:hypothetical protein n=1 Tax=Microaerobacter geothermalis TaxID=674972 RepID=UPI001F3ABDBB|nr:hypothetical protein [Microaerobacter geothermalis]MCF6094756.1 hypothetical protein [Microaerobacter geothermalis]